MINMELVAAHVHTELPDVPCYVEMSGGNNATIYMGTAYWIKENGEVEHGVAGVPLDVDIFIPVLGGPGTYAPAPPEAHPEEFSIGYDGNDPDDEIAAVNVDGWDVDGADEKVIAARMCQLWRDHPRGQA